ncbi:MAG TPA: MarR family transcriptional regulator [Dehalococcoidia bacterium]|jgi:DNA-binding MarR family transcriptional regulator|nr:MarR family transcriptional regulator [Dehalococcoidia bacterium]
MEQTVYDNQISTIVHGFIQVWNKFEATLSKELAQIQENIRGVDSGRESHRTANYELFYRVSSTIYLKDSLTMGELSNNLSVPLSTATRIVDWLVDNGYMERLPDPEDRRIVRVTLTGVGRELHKTMDNYVRQRVQNILSCLSEEDRSMLIGLINKVVSALREATR